MVSPGHGTGETYFPPDAKTPAVSTTQVSDAESRTRPMLIYVHARRRIHILLILNYSRGMYD